MDTIVPLTSSAPAERRAGWLDRIARRMVLRTLAGMHDGHIELMDREDRAVVGSDSGERVTVRVLDPRFYRAIATGGALGAGEAFIKGWWACDDLTRLIRLMLRNEPAFANLNSGVTQVAELAERVRHALRRNTLEGSRRNIAAHYDLGNDFFALILDETMMYSCGIFETPASGLRDASIAKIERICGKLELKPGDHLLEIGTGWGGFALHAARHYGCRITTTTISRRQFEYAQRRVAQAGLQDRIQVLLQDYRALTGRYDKLVSIEMIEAVGWQYFDTFFRRCGDLLRPGGLACIQAITIAPRFYERAKRKVDFIKRYVFPGSCIPSVPAMSDSLSRSSDLEIVHLEEIGLHYATTLRFWRERTDQHEAGLRRMGYPESFLRLWRFYLCYCEAGFLERSIGTVQMLLARPQYDGPAVRGLAGRARRVK